MDQDGKAHNDRDAVLAADVRSEESRDDSKNVCVPLDDISALNVLLGSPTAWKPDRCCVRRSVSGRATRVIGPTCTCLMQTDPSAGPRHLLLLR
jgi:hypothetical protein